MSSTDVPDSTGLPAGSLTDRLLSAPRPVTPISIISARLEALSLKIGMLDQVEPELKAELRVICEIASGLDPYLEECTTPESAALKLIAERTQAHAWDGSAVGQQGALEQEMLSGHVEGQTLKLLVHVTQAQRVLEIGMFTGYSALAMAEALPDNGELVACEIDAAVAEFAKKCFEESPSGHKIDVRVAPALETLQELAAAGETFDLVFIDADKAGYVEYFNTVLDSGLVTPQGLICVDNTLMQGQSYLAEKNSANGVAIAEFNKVVATEPRVEQVLLPLRDGLTLIRLVDAG